jgi:hypothetical protein
MRGTWGRESSLESIYNEIEGCSLLGLREVTVRRNKRKVFNVVTTQDSGQDVISDVGSLQ